MRLLIGTLVGILALWLAFRGESFSGLADAIRQSDVLWVVTALVSVAPSLLLVTVRWQAFFRGQDRERAVPRLRSLFTGVMLGQAANIALPIRVGELLRVYVVSRAEHLAVARVLATVALERLADTLMMAIGAGILVLQIAFPDWLIGPARGLAILGVIAAGLLGAVVIAGRPLSVLIHARVMASTSRGLARLARHGANAVEEAANLRDLRTLATIAALSVLTLLMSTTTNYLLFKAFHLELPFVAGLLLLIVLQVGTAPFSTPGSLGVFQYLTILALSVYSVDRTQALAYSVLLYAVALMPKLLVGGLMLGFATKNGLLEPGIWAKLRGRA
jgi:hypothetical protein